MLGETGRPDFNALQNGRGPFTYVAFDLLHVDGEWIVRPPLERAARAPRGHRDARSAPPRLMLSDHVAGEGQRPVRAAAEAQGLEGVIAKRMDAPYRPGPPRAQDWRKVKSAPGGGGRDRRVHRGRGLAPRHARGAAGGRARRRGAPDVPVARRVRASRTPSPGRCGTACGRRRSPSRRSPNPVPKAPGRAALGAPRAAVRGALRRAHARRAAARPGLPTAWWTTTGADVPPGRSRGATGDRTVQEGDRRVTLTNLDKLYWPREGITEGPPARPLPAHGAGAGAPPGGPPHDPEALPERDRGGLLLPAHVTDAPALAAPGADLSRGGKPDEKTSRLRRGGRPDGAAVAGQPGLHRPQPLAEPRRRARRADPRALRPRPGRRAALRHGGRGGPARARRARGGGPARLPAHLGRQRDAHPGAGRARAHLRGRAPVRAGRVSEALVRARPDLVTTRTQVADRGPRVYLDHNQNGRGRSIASVYSVRPRPGRAGGDAAALGGGARRDSTRATSRWAWWRRAWSAEGDLAARAPRRTSRTWATRWPGSSARAGEGGAPGAGGGPRGPGPGGGGLLRHGDPAPPSGAARPGGDRLLRGPATPPGWARRWTSSDRTPPRGGARGTDARPARGRGAPVVGDRLGGQRGPARVPTPRFVAVMMSGRAVPMPSVRASLSPSDGPARPPGPPPARRAPVADPPRRERDLHLLLPDVDPRQVESVRMVVDGRGADLAQRAPPVGDQAARRRTDAPCPPMSTHSPSASSATTTGSARPSSRSRATWPTTSPTSRSCRPTRWPGPPTAARRPSSASPRPSATRATRRCSAPCAAPSGRACRRGRATARWALPLSPDGLDAALAAERMSLDDAAERLTSSGLGAIVSALGTRSPARHRRRGPRAHRWSRSSRSAWPARAAPWPR